MRSPARALRSLLPGGPPRARRALPLLGAVTLVVLAVATPGSLAVAAAPSEGTISKPKDEVTWSGSFVASNAVQCLGPDDPSCDHFILRVESNAVKRVSVSIAPAEGFEDDDYDLFIYDDQGNYIGSETSGDGYETVVFEHTGAAFYEIRVQPWLVDPGSSYNGVAMRTKEEPAIDIAGQDCDEFVPASVGVDTGQTVELSVLILLDGTDPAVAETTFLKAAESYLPQHIDLVVVETQQVSFTAPDPADSGDIIQQMKDHVGGLRPEGIDIVGVFTNKNMQTLVNGAPLVVVGQADCIGGVRYDDRAFFVFKDLTADEGPSGTLGDLGLNDSVDSTAEVMAHEIGHLMGAHHHYANCAEGNLTSAGPDDVSPCTLMFNCVCNASLNFGTLSGVVVRGHAVDFAQP